MGLRDWLPFAPAKSTDELLALARALAAASRFRDAVRVYAQIRRRDHTPSILAETASACLAAGDTLGALDRARRARDMDPRCAAAICVQGEILLLESRTSEALDRFREALAADPECRAARHRLEQYAPPTPVPEPGPWPPDDAEARLDALLDQFGQAFQARRLLDALAALQTGLALARARLGEYHLKTAKFYHNLGILLYLLRQKAESRRCLEQALAITARVQGEDHPDTADCLRQLGNVLHQQDEPGPARQAMERCVAIREKALGDHAATAQALNDLGSILASLGDRPAARQCLERAVALRRGLLGTHADTAESLQNLGVLLQRERDWAGARRLLEEALAVRRQVWGDQHPQTAGSLHALGLLLREAGDPRGARACLEEALAIREKVLGEHRDTAASLHGLGAVCDDANDWAEARRCYERALAIRQWRLGEHPETAVSLNNLGVLLGKMGDYAGAKTYFEQALALRQRLHGDDHPETATSLRHLGAALDHLGDRAAARRCVERALAVQRRAPGCDPSDLAATLGALAHLCANEADWKEARRLYEEALALERQAWGDGHPATAGTLANLATVLHHQGDWEGAQRCYEEALAALQPAGGGDRREMAIPLCNLGALLKDRGDLGAAQRYLERALALHRKFMPPGHPATGGILNNLGTVLHDQGRLPEARACYEEALAIQRQAGAEHFDTGPTLNNLGSVLQDLGDWAGARRCYEQAGDIHRKALGGHHPAVAPNLSNLGTLLQAHGQWQEAAACFEQALAIYRQSLGNEHPDTAATLENLAGVWVALDQPDRAFPLVLEAAAILDHVIGQVFLIGSERQRATYLQKIQGSLYWVLSLTRADPRPERVHAALELVWRRKAIVAESLATQRDVILGGKYPDLTPRFQELAALRMRIAEKTVAGPGADGLAAHQSLLARWADEKEALEKELARQVPEMNLRRWLQAADRRAVAAALPAGSVLVEFVRFWVYDFKAVALRLGDALGLSLPRWRPARYLAFLLPAGEPEGVRLIDLGEAESIDRLIAAFRAGITGEAEGRGPDGGTEVVPGPSDSAAEPDAGVRLRQALWEPLRAALAGRSRVLLAPDGELTRLPFEVLPEAGGRRLIDAWQISYLSTARDVLRFGAEAGGRPTEPLVVADPAFDLAPAGPAVVPAAGAARGAGPGLPAGEDEGAAGVHPPRPRDPDLARLRFGRLPGTRAEGECVARLLGVEPWLGAAALEGRLKARRAPRIVHAATHGFFLKDQERDRSREQPSWGASAAAGAALPEDPLLRSGLALAGANGKSGAFHPQPEAEDGLLTAEDVASLDLLGTELVVLSACETGLGEVRVGEGVFGLRRAFVLAGARALVMSLWKVPDLATAVLMERFYDNLLTRRLGRAEALREAQAFTRDVSVTRLRQTWLTPEGIERLAAGDERRRPQLRRLASRPADDCPFRHPRCWGAFICQGEPGPLRGSHEPV